MEYKYEVALSFAGEEREYVRQVAKILQEHGLNVFYDEHFTVEMWGEDLITYLASVYSSESKFVIPFISKHYAEKLWTRHEIKNAFINAFLRDDVVILPARFDDSPLDGLSPTVWYADLRVISQDDFIGLILEKLGKTSIREETSSAVEIMQHSEDEVEQQELEQIISLLDIIKNNPDLTEYYKFVFESGFEYQLKTQPLTLFVPTNSAFERFKDIWGVTLANLSEERTKRILQYHSSANVLPPSGLQYAINQGVSTNFAAHSVFISKYDNNSIYINGSSVLDVDITAGNGVLYIIDDVLMPADQGNGSISTIIKANPHLRLLSIALEQVERVHTSPLRYLLGIDANLFTLFAPTNEAFIEAGYNEQMIQEESKVKLVNLFVNILISGRRIYLRDLPSGRLQHSREWDSHFVLSTNPDGNTTLQLNGVGESATIVYPNITATNGVLHLIDKLLVSDL